jgi:hypothetical protein
VCPTRAVCRPSPWHGATRTSETLKPAKTPKPQPQPTHVSWKLDGSTLEHRTRGQRMQWQAWDGPKDRIFEPPSKPMHMTMSTVRVMVCFS